MNLIQNSTTSGFHSVKLKELYFCEELCNIENKLLLIHWIYSQRNWRIHTKLIKLSMKSKWRVINLASEAYWIYFIWIHSSTIQSFDTYLALFFTLYMHVQCEGKHSTMVRHCGDEIQFLKCSFIIQHILFSHNEASNVYTLFIWNLL